MELQDKRVAVLVEDLFQELELWYPVLRMREAGATVNIVGTRKAVFHSKNGYAAEADMVVTDAQPADFDAVIVPGGYAPDIMRRNAHLTAFVRDMHQQGKVVAAICHAGWVLVSAGILKGKQATSVPAIKDDVIKAGATWVDREVVVDGRLITSRTPADLPAFCREIIRALQG